MAHKEKKPLKNIKDTMKQIDKELKKIFSNVNDTEISDFFPPRRRYDHNKIKKKLEELGIYDELYNKIKENLRDKS